MNDSGAVEMLANATAGRRAWVQTGKGGERTSNVFKEKAPQNGRMGKQEGRRAFLDQGNRSKA